MSVKSATTDVTANIWFKTAHPIWRLVSGLAGLLMLALFYYLGRHPAKNSAPLPYYKFVMMRPEAANISRVPQNVLQPPPVNLGETNWILRYVKLLGAPGLYFILAGILIATGINLMILKPWQRLNIKFAPFLRVTSILAFFIFPGAITGGHVGAVLCPGFLSIWAGLAIPAVLPAHLFSFAVTWLIVMLVGFPILLLIYWRKEKGPS